MLAQAPMHQFESRSDICQIFIYFEVNFMWIFCEY
jgi:hypothetical protein